MNEVMALQLPVLHITCYTYKSKKDSKVGGQEGDRGEGRVGTVETGREEKTVKIKR